MTDGQLARIRQGYLRKLFDPRSWARLLTFKTDVRLLARAFRKPASAKPATSVRRGASPRRPPPAPAPTSNLNPHFAPAFFAAADRGMRMLLIFSETDRLWWEFDEKFLRAHPGVLERYADRVSVSVVPDANHIFTLEPWQLEAERRLAAWLESEIGAASGRRRRAPARIMNAPSSGPAAVASTSVPAKTILVTDGGSRAALAVTRALGRRGHRVIVGDRRRPSLAHASRYCAVAVQYPDPVHDEQGCLDAIVARRRRAPGRRRPAGHRHRHRAGDARPRSLRRRAIVPYADADLVARASDKWHVIETARRCGTPVPGRAGAWTARRRRCRRRCRFRSSIKPHRSRVRTPEGWLLVHGRLRRRSRRASRRELAQRQPAAVPADPAGAHHRSWRRPVRLLRPRPRDRAVLPSAPAREAAVGRRQRAVARAPPWTRPRGACARGCSTRSAGTASRWSSSSATSATARRG